jgi:hypothetical protein
MGIILRRKPKIPMVGDNELPLPAAPPKILSEPERQVAYLTARVATLEATLRQIERQAEYGISKYGITQQPPGPPEAWTTRINAVLDVAGPIRDAARKALAQ